MFDLTRFVDRHEDALVARLRRLPGVEVMQSVDLELDSATISAGTRPSAIFRDPAGRLFMFKAAEPALIAGEELAFEIRSMADRPHVPVTRRSLEIPEIGRVEGMIQPIVEHAGSQLPHDPRLWTLLQREVLLREHPWEWFLANLDTHVEQYVLMGPQLHPLNIDWDHAMWDIDVIELTRFTKRGLAIAPIRNLLYDAYANRAIKLDFFGLRREIASIARLDPKRVREAIERYGQRLGVSDPARRLLWEKVEVRWRTLNASFERLIASMRLERAEMLSAPSSPVAKVRRGVTRAQDVWQRLLVTVIHEQYIRRFFKLYRNVLAKRAKDRAH